MPAARHVRAVMSVFSGSQFVVIAVTRMWPISNYIATIEGNEMNMKMAACVMMTMATLLSQGVGAADSDGKVAVDWTIETCVGGSAVFGKAGACYIVDLKTLHSCTKVKVCGGLSVGLGAGASVNASEVICMTLTVPGTNREAALRSAQEILNDELFWRRLRKEDTRAKRLEEALSGRRLSTPNDGELARLEDLLEAIGK